MNTKIFRNFSFKKLFVIWLPIAFVTSMLCVFAYVAVQQNYRLSANDPQIQIAEDTAASLAGGADPQLLNSLYTIDIAKSVSPFITVYDMRLEPIASTGSLDGEFPKPPLGVFAFALKKENHATWQPRPDVRQAIVIVHYGGNNPGFVVAGRSVRETEIRIAQLTQLFFATWFIALLGSFMLTALGVFFS